MIGLADASHREDLLRQADVAVVTGYCGCGCPTVDREVDASLASPIDGERVVIGADWAPRDDDGGGVLLFIIEGWLSLLEVWWVVDAPPAQLLPRSEVVRPA
jgi:hypothetical protein